jgi:hypothetical protein
VDLPGESEDFDYDRFVEQEFKGGARPRRMGKVWAIVAAVLLAALVIPLLRGCSG